MRSRSLDQGGHVMRRSSLTLLTLSFGFVQLGCSDAESSAAAWTTTIDTVGTRIVQVTNVPPASGIQPFWSIEPEHRIGAVDGSGQDVFGQIKGIAPLPDGRIAVLDAQAQEIRIFGPTGQFLRSFGGKGEGPGELNDANGLVAGADGIIRVHDPRNARMTLFDPDTGLLSSERLEIYSFGFTWAATIDSAGRIYEPTRFRFSDGVWSLVKVYDGQGRWSDTIRIALDPPSSGVAPGTYLVERGTTRMFMTVPFWQRGANALDPRGFFWAKGPHVNDYRIAQTTLAGDTLLIIESRRPALEVSSSERDSVIAALRERTGQELDWSQIPGTKPIVEGIILDDSGRIWVRVRGDDTSTTFDVFDRRGVYAGTAVSPLRLASSPAPTIIGDRLYAVHTDALGVAYVIQARIREVQR
jgi:hypothetical protein